MSAERNFAIASFSYHCDDDEQPMDAREHQHYELMRAAAYNDLFIAPQCYAGQLKPEAHLDMDIEHLLWQKQGMDIALGADWHHDAIKLALGV